MVKREPITPKRKTTAVAAASPEKAKVRSSRKTNVLLKGDVEAAIDGVLHCPSKEIFKAPSDVILDAAFSAGSGIAQSGKPANGVSSSVTDPGAARPAHSDVILVSSCVEDPSSDPCCTIPVNPVNVKVPDQDSASSTDPLTEYFTETAAERNAMAVTNQGDLESHAVAETAAATDTSGTDTSIDTAGSLQTAMGPTNLMGEARLPIGAPVSLGPSGSDAAFPLALRGDGQDAMGRISTVANLVNMVVQQTSNQVSLQMTDQLTPIVSSMRGLQNAAGHLASLQQHSHETLVQVDARVTNLSSQTVLMDASLRALEQQHTAYVDTLTQESARNEGEFTNIRDQLTSLGSRLSDLQLQLQQQEQQQQQAAAAATAAAMAANSSASSGYESTAFVGGFPPHTVQKKIFDKISEMVDALELRGQLCDMWSKRYAQGGSVKFTSIPAMWRFINGVPMSLKVFECVKNGVNVTTKLWINKSNQQPERARRTNTRRVAKMISQRFGASSDAIYIDVASHCVYMHDLPIVEIGSHGDPLVHEECLKEAWAICGNQGAPPCEEEVVYIAYTAGLCEGMSAEAVDHVKSLVGNPTAAKAENEDEDEMDQDELQAHLLSALSPTAAADTPVEMDATATAAAANAESSGHVRPETDASA